MSNPTIGAEQQPITSGRGVGCWRIDMHGKRYSGLLGALSAVHSAHADRKDLIGLADALLPRLPGLPRTSENLKEAGARSQKRGMEDVVTSDSWLGMNTEFAVNVLWSETDQEGLAERLALMRSYGVPVQAWTACGEVGGHVAYILRAPIVTGLGDTKADQKRLNLVSVTRSLLTTAINGDHNAGLRGMTKNPFAIRTAEAGGGMRWDVNVGAIQFLDMHDILKPLLAMAEAEGWKRPKRRFKNDRVREPSPEGRNCALFDLTRWWAQDNLVRARTEILAMVTELNAELATPLGMGEVQDISISVTKFMSRYDGQGVSARLTPEDVHARQAAAGRSTAAGRAAKTDEKLRAAVQDMLGRGETPGQRTVALEAGVSIVSVQRRWGMIWSMLTCSPPADTDMHEAGDDSCDDACEAAEVPLAETIGTLDIAETIEAASHSVNTCSDAVLYPIVACAGPCVIQLPTISAPHPPHPPHPYFLQTLLDAGNAVLHLPGDGLVHLRDHAAVQASVGDGNGRFLFPGWLLPFMPGVRKLPELPADHDERTPEGMRRAKRVNGAQRCEERRRWHMRAAFNGIRAYVSERSARYMVMCRQRTDDMARFSVEMSMSDAENYPLSFILDSEERDLRRHQAAMGWASRFRAEHRMGRAWCRALNARAGYTSYGSWHGTLPLQTMPELMPEPMPYAIHVQASDTLSLAA